MTFNTGKKDHALYGAELLKPVNNCACLLNTSSEVYADIQLFNGYRIEVYMATNNRRARAIIYNDNKEALSVCYFETLSGLVIYGYTAEQYRKQGIYKGLKGFINSKRQAQKKPLLWSQFQSADYMQAFA